MIPERQRVPEDSGEMGETMYDAPPPAPKPQAAKQTPPQALQTAPAQTPAAYVAPSQAARPTIARADAMPKQAPAPGSGNNSMLRTILGVAAALFALSILTVVVLYLMGKI